MQQYTLKHWEGKFILLSTILASGMGFLDGTVVSIAFPVIQQKLHASFVQMEWVINLYALMLASLILIAGSLGDRFGRRRIFAVGIALFTVSSFLCSISGSILQLILFRGVQGVGAAMMIPGSLSIINTSFAESHRGRVIGIWSGLAGGVASLGPFLGGFLVQTFGWPSIFYINIPFGILALFLAIKFIPETKNEESTRLDILGTVLIFSGLLGIVYGLITGPEKGWQSSLVTLSIIIGSILTALFVWVEMKSKHPLVPFQIFKSLTVTGANLITFFLYGALGAMIIFIILNFQQIQHYSELMSGLGLLPAILIITFGSGPGGVLADKFGPRMPLIIGPIIVAVGMASMAIPGKGANYFISFMPGLILFGVGMSFVVASVTKSALAVEAKFSGAASGFNNAVSRLAGLLAVAVLGALIISLFTMKLHQSLTSSPLPPGEQKQIISQQNKLGAIEIPDSFSENSKTMARDVIDDSFVYGFRWAIGICAAMAFLSAILAYFTIRTKKS